MWSAMSMIDEPLSRRAAPVGVMRSSTRLPRCLWLMCTSTLVVADAFPVQPASVMALVTVAMSLMVTLVPWVPWQVAGTGVAVVGAGAGVVGVVGAGVVGAGV